MANRGNLKQINSHHLHSKKRQCRPITLDGEEFKQDITAKYQGMHDKKLNWQKHIWSKRIAFYAKLRSMYWMIDNRS